MDAVTLAALLCANRKLSNVIASLKSCHAMPHLQFPLHLARLIFAAQGNTLAIN